MLGSLLPGLREVRVPLTVGYLWLFALWLVFAELLPRTRPSGGDVVARSFDLLELAGVPAMLAVLSFCAYLLGAVVTIPVSILGKSNAEINPSQPAVRPAPTNASEGGERRGLSWIYTHGGSRAARAFRNSEATATYFDFGARLLEVGHELEARGNSLSPTEFHAFERAISKAGSAGTSSLRPRLLIANQDLYGEYDRIVSEGDFRINVSVPLFAIGLLLATTFQSPIVSIVLSSICILLFISGMRRLASANSVMQRAVLNRIITHPLEDLLARFGNSSPPEAAS